MIESGRWWCGVDVGSSATKLVLVDRELQVRAKAVKPSGVDYAATADACLSEALAQVGATRPNVVRTVSTGHGRRNVTFSDDSRTEIHCHGIGGYHRVPRAITVVDIGGQDNKVIRLDEHGNRIDFRMNRKCSAGTGSFIEEVAHRLAIDVGSMDAFARSTNRTVRLSSFCTVFAKTEILAHLRQGVPVAEIVRGAFQSVVQRVIEMDPLEGEVVLTGGVVAHNPTLADMLSEHLARRASIAPDPQFVGALGAALLATRHNSGD